MDNKDVVIVEVDEEYPELDYLMNSCESDVVFVVDGQRVPALKQVLKLKSKVFRAMFSGDFKESDEKEITIEETSYEAFKALIRFIYTDKLVLNDENDLNLLREVIKLGDRYQVLRIYHSMSAVIKKNLNLENFEYFCKICYEFKAKPLFPLLKEFMAKNFEQFYCKDINELKRINDITNQSWFEVLNERFAIGKRVYASIVPGQHYYRNINGQYSYAFTS